MCSGGDALGKGVRGIGQQSMHLVYLAKSWVCITRRGGFITLCFWKHATLNGSIGYPESHLGSDLLTQTVSSSIPGLCYRISLTGIAF